MHAAFRLHGETDILFDAEVWKQIGELERAAEAGAGAQRRGKLRDIFAIEQDAASAGPQLSGDQVEIGGLASPVGADNGGQLARPKTAAHMIDSNMSAEADGQIACLESMAHQLPRDHAIRCCSPRPACGGEVTRSSLASSGRRKKVSACCGSEPTCPRSSVRVPARARPS